MPRAYKVTITAEAEANIADACTWIAQSDPAAARRWYSGLIRQLHTLAHLPARCPLAPETKLGLTDCEVRQLLYGRNFWKYRILFAIIGDEVVVAHVRHGARLYLGQSPPGD
jgi:plasmid stabilization system protein ParE